MALHTAITTELAIAGFERYTLHLDIEKMVVVVALACVDVVGGGGRWRTRHPPRSWSFVRALASLHLYLCACDSMVER